MRDTGFFKPYIKMKPHFEGVGEVLACVALVDRRQAAEPPLRAGRLLALQCGELLLQPATERMI